VIPPDSTVVIALVGIEAVGQPLCDTIAHRWEVIAHLLRIHEGDILTPSRVAELLSHDAGGRKGIPPTSRFIVFLNRVEDAQALEAARSVAQLIAQRGRAERILIGSALSPDPIQEVIQ
jgi:molybdenum cofactor cytidylyltransferase